MTDVGWFNDILRGFFGGIDYIIYQLIAWILEGIFNLASLYGNGNFLSVIYKRIYIFLGIYMVFKLTISFINYLISPDKMSDKEQGAGKMISRVIIMLILVIGFPIIALENVPGKDGSILLILQNGGLKTLPKVILGISGDNSSAQSNAKSNGNYMATLMLRSFYYPIKCDTISDSDTSCDPDTAVNNISLDTFVASLKTPDPDNTSIYHYKYMWPLTTISGIVLVIILLGLTIDVAIRVFKLIVLEMIAPVPIMSYIDPKSSKDGAFSSWIKMFISTYLDLFIKLGSVYLLLFLLSKLFQSGDYSLFGDDIKNISGFMSRTYVKVFLIIGLFKFVKDAPKFIKDALGIKDSGGGGGFIGKAASGLAGAAAGFAGGVAAGGLAGGLSGMTNGFSMGSQNAGSGKPTKAFSQVRDAQRKALGKGPGGLAGTAQRISNRGIAKKMGITASTLEAAKRKMINDQSVASDAQDIYDRFKDGTVSDAELRAWARANGQSYDATRGTMTDSNGVVRTARKALYDDLSGKQSVATKSQKNYEKGSKIADGLDGVNAYNDDKYSKSYYHRAKRGIHNASTVDHQAEYANEQQGTKTPGGPTKATRKGQWDAGAGVNPDDLKW